MYLANLPLSYSPWSSWWRSCTAPCSWNRRWKVGRGDYTKARTSPDDTRRYRRCGCSSRWSTGAGTACRKLRRSSQEGIRPRNFHLSPRADIYNGQWRDGTSLRSGICACTFCCNPRQMSPRILKIKSVLNRDALNQTNTHKRVSRSGITLNSVKHLSHVFCINSFIPLMNLQTRNRTNILPDQ